MSNVVARYKDACAQMKKNNRRLRVLEVMWIVCSLIFVTALWVNHGWMIAVPVITGYICAFAHGYCRHITKRAQRDVDEFGEELRERGLLE